MSLSLENITLPLSTFAVEADVRLDRGVTVLFGPSGSGKTSLLEIIAGLRRPHTGKIELNQRTLVDVKRSVFIPPQARRLGYVPQDLALFPHLNVRQNLEYGFRTGNSSSLSWKQVVALLEIEELLPRPMDYLSGGEKQRVALARALLTGPEILLLDEPLANLDQPLKTRILPFFRKIVQECRLPMLYVTHDRFETLALADQMAVMAQGKVQQVGGVPEVFSRPANLQVANIVAVETIQPGTILKTQDDLATVQVGRAELTALNAASLAAGQAVHVCIRAEDVVLFLDSDTSGSPRNRLRGEVTAIVPYGPMVRIEVDCGFPLAVLLTKPAVEEMNLHPGRKVMAFIKAPQVCLVSR